MQRDAHCGLTRQIGELGKRCICQTRLEHLVDHPPLCFLRQLTYMQQSLNFLLLLGKLTDFRRRIRIGRCDVQVIAA
ncbi:hypothetical protein D3C73_1430870 [compost metagenome]